MKLITYSIYQFSFSVLRAKWPKFQGANSTRQRGPFVDLKSDHDARIGSPKGESDHLENTGVPWAASYATSHIPESQAPTKTVPFGTVPCRIGLLH